MSPIEDPFRVVVVSAADVSRGPAVQRVLRAHLAALGSSERVALTSAGTTAVAGRPMHPHMARALTEVTPDASPHLSRPVSERRLAQADLILTVSRAERRRVGELRPPVAGRTFTVVEFARLVARMGEPIDDPRHLVGLLAGLRSEIRPVDPGEDDLEDPTPGEYRDHERVVRRVDHAARDIARGLAGKTPPGGGSGLHVEASPTLRTRPTPAPVLPGPPARATPAAGAGPHALPAQHALPTPDVEGAKNGIDLTDSSLDLPDDAVATGHRSGEPDSPRHG